MIESALMIARIFGPFLAIVGLWMLLYSDNLVKIVTSIKNSPAAIYQSAILNLVFGLFIISGYNGWRMDAFFFVTLLGWALFIRGVLGLFMPQVLIKLMTKSSWVKLMGIIPFIWGLILIWAGFYR